MLCLSLQTQTLLCATSTIKWCTLFANAPLWQRALGNSITQHWAAVKMCLVSHFFAQFIQNCISSCLPFALAKKKCPTAAAAADKVVLVSCCHYLVSAASRTSPLSNCALQQRLFSPLQQHWTIAIVCPSLKLINSNKYKGNKKKHEWALEREREKRMNRQSSGSESEQCDVNIYNELQQVNTQLVAVNAAAFLQVFLKLCLSQSLVLFFALKSS